jgi:glycine cleavage system H protein
MSVPDGLKYTDHDEWVRVDGDVVTVGITHFAQDQLGELVHVELPEVGDAIEQGDEACEVESVKAVAEIYAPLSGEVVEVNESLEDDAEQVNNAPYDAWIFKLRVADSSQLDGLMEPEDYRAKIGG